MFKTEKLKTIEIINLARGFNELAVAGEQEGMPAKLSYKLARQITKLQDASKSFQEQAEKLLKKHGEEKEQGSYTIKDIEAYKADMQSLESIEEEVELLSEKIKLDEIEGVKVKTSTMITLEKFIEA